MYEHLVRLSLWRLGATWFLDYLAPSRAMMSSNSASRIRNSEVTVKRPRGTSGINYSRASNHYYERPLLECQNAKSYIVKCCDAFPDNGRNAIVSPDDRHVRHCSDSGVRLRDDRVSADHRVVLANELGLSYASPAREQDLLAGACADLAVWAAMNYTRLSFPPVILWLLACLAFAGLSTTWAFKPETSFVRFAQQAMIIIAIVIPAMLAGARGFDARPIHLLCDRSGAESDRRITRPPIDVKFATWGYPGYFSGKNYLGRVCSDCVSVVAA